MSTNNKLAEIVKKLVDLCGEGMKLLESQSTDPNYLKKLEIFRARFNKLKEEIVRNQEFSKGFREEVNTVGTEVSGSIFIFVISRGYGGLLEAKGGLEHLVGISQEYISADEIKNILGRHGITAERAEEILSKYG